MLILAKMHFTMPLPSGKIFFKKYVFFNADFETV